MLKPCVVIVFVFVIYNLFVIIQIESKVTITKLTLCKGPKRKDCCINKAVLLNSTAMLYYMNILKDIAPDKGKITVYNNNKLLMNLQMKKPCDHLFLKSLFRLKLNMTSDCVFKKGNYSLTFDLVDLLRYGGMHLNGNMTTKALFYNDDCNFSCTFIELKF